MNPETFKAWLRKKKQLGFAQHLLVGIVALLGGTVILFLTFWFTYAVIWFGWYGVSAVSEMAFSKKLHLAQGIRLAGSGGFLVLLFIQHFRTNPWHWGDYPKDDYLAVPGLQAHAGVAGGLASLLAYPGASANMVADILLTGPRLVTGAFRLMGQGNRLRRLDENGCAELIAFLYGRFEAVPYEELKSAGWEAWFGQMRGVEGVQFLQKGLALTSELRSELGGMKG